MVYNTSQEAMILPKNLMVGWCQLVLQPNQDAYIQELAATQQERCAKQRDEVNHHQIAAMKLEERILLIHGSKMIQSHFNAKKTIYHVLQIKQSSTHVLRKIKELNL